jgi:hypothetical protein
MPPSRRLNSSFSCSLSLRGRPYHRLMFRVGSLKALFPFHFNRTVSPHGSFEAACTRKTWLAVCLATLRRTAEECCVVWTYVTACCLRFTCSLRLPALWNVGVIRWKISLWANTERNSNECRESPYLKAGKIALRPKNYPNKGKSSGFFNLLKRPEVLFILCVPPVVIFKTLRFFLDMYLVRCCLLLSQ